MPPNTAAWLTSEKSRLEVKPAPYTPPPSNEIVIKTGAVAVSFVDWATQAMGIFPLQYPTIIGNDIAGEVFDVGSSVTRFKKGDRVLAHAPFMMGSLATPEAAFQQYVVCLPHLAAQIPSSVSFEQAATMPLAITTASAGLFEKENLGLKHPSLSPKPTGKTLLIWGGASSVGCNAIQLATSAGYEVITTASAKNFDLMKKLGAVQVIDYTSATVVGDLVTTFKNRDLVGAFEASGKPAGVLGCAEVLLKSEGGKFIASVQRLPEGIPSGVTAKFFIATSIKDNGIAELIYGGFLPEALAQGKYIPVPEPKVVGKGIEHIQDALDAIPKGDVSAQKLVVSL
jgi:NADPH:quinone reductase-like Zn-dependent oxidoreductase